MEQDLSIKDILLYCVKRWYVFLLSAVLCGVVGAVSAAFSEKETMRYGASAYICDFETFQAATNSELTDLEVKTSYEEQAARALDAMVSGDNAMRFLENPAHRSLVEKLSRASNLLGYLEENLELGWRPYRIAIWIETDGKVREQEIKDLLNAYAVFMQERAYERAEVFAGMKSAGAVAVAQAEYIGSTTEKKSFAQTILVYFIGGLAAAAVLTLALYFIDPKMKSANEPERLGFPVLAKIPDRQFTEKEVSGLLVKLDKAKRICVAEPDGSESDNFCKSLASIWQSSGYSVLWINGCVAGGRFKNYLSGAAIEGCLEEKAGIHTMAFSSFGDGLSLSPNKERLDALDKIYGKIIFSCRTDIPGAAAAVSAHCDSVVCMIDRNKAKTKNIRRLRSQLSENVQRPGAVVYGCKE